MKRVLNAMSGLALTLALTASVVVAQATGPDVIVGSLHNTANHGSVGSIAAFSVGTTSCNIGTSNLNWISNTNQHPVIGQNLYRLKNGRFEQIGMSWLKHGFFALSGTLCGGCPVPTDGSTLGVGCSDPYDAGLNGQQSGLGPRSEVNASSGFYPYPFTNPSGANNAIRKRLQVAIADIDPAQNAGALYFVEGHYVTNDDAAAGNKNNNASYRRVQFTGSGPYQMSFVTGFGTQQQMPAIRAWGAFDNGVAYSTVDVPNDGRFTVAFKATDNGNGTWHYEYALHNLNSHRSGNSFSVPSRPGEVFSNIGFQDVNYHTGDGNVIGTNYDGTDWAATVNANDITWSTSTFGADPNANALRWGTMYTFRYDSNMAPASAQVAVTIGLYRPGVPSDVSVNIDPPTTLVATGGDMQWTDLNTSFSQPLSVRAQTAGGVGIGGITVNFTLTGPSGVASLSAASAVTDANGDAQVMLSGLGNAGTVTVTAATTSNSVTFTEYVQGIRTTFTGASGVEVFTVTTQHPSFRNQPLLFCIDAPQPPHSVLGYTVCTTVDAPQPGFAFFDGIGLFGAPDATVRTNPTGSWTRVITGLGVLFNTGISIQAQAIMFPGFVYISNCATQTF